MDSILAIIFQNAKEIPDTPCVADGSGPLTYRRYSRRIAGAAAALRDRGLNPGERVVIRCTQDADFLVSIHAVQLAGGISVPVEKGCAQTRIDAISAQTKAAFVLNPRELSGLESDEIIPLPNPGAALSDSFHNRHYRRLQGHLPSSRSGRSRGGKHLIWNKNAPRKHRSEPHAAEPFGGTAEVLLQYAGGRHIRHCRRTYGHPAPF